MDNHKFRNYSIFFVLLSSVVALYFYFKVFSYSIYTINGRTMGTTYSIKIVATSLQIEVEKIQKDIDHLLSEINQQMSTYINDSEISIFNTSNSLEPQEVSKGFFEVLEFSKYIFINSQGYFDPTVAPIVNYWGFGPNKRQVDKPETQIEKDILALKELVGFNKIDVIKPNLLAKKKLGIQVDLSAIAKGYAVDKVSNYLLVQNFVNHLVEIGGEIKGIGFKEPKEQTNWKVAVERPKFDGSKEIDLVIPLFNGCLATSGNYRNFYQKDGQLISHTIDPKTYYPAKNQTLSVSVFDSQCVLADGFATALMAMGTQRALQFADENNLAMYIQYILEEDGSRETKASIKWNVKFEDLSI